jgi:hypothetical protein
MPPRPILAAIGLSVVVFVVTRSDNLHAPAPGDRGLGTVSSNFVAAFMPAAISLILLFAALWVVLSRRYTAADKHWAYATAGSIAGFWFHT